MTQIITGQLLRFTADPFDTPPEEAVRFDAHGAIWIEGGRVRAAGPVDEVRAKAPAAPETSMGDALLLPGFVDAHMHYPQTGMIASWGKRLIDWLNTYTFPEEMRLSDPVYARDTANLTLDLALANGTTTLSSFCTVAPGSVDAFFEAAEARGMAVMAGRTCMDRNAPEGLRDTAKAAHDESAALIKRWHGRGRARYAITPRFTPTSTPEQLEALGSLWAENPTCAMQTHLSEQVDEVAWVEELEPWARDYLETYEKFGLIGPGALFGHAIHLTERERAGLKASGSAVVHCPTSNTFIGSGVFDMARMKADGITTGLATDTGGGSSFSMLRTMAAAYEIGQLSGTALHPAQLLWLATESSARAMRMEQEVGTLEEGSAADIVALDLASTKAISQRSERARNVWEAVFPTIMMGDDRAIAGTWVAGERRV